MSEQQPTHERPGTQYAAVLLTRTDQQPAPTPNPAAAGAYTKAAAYYQADARDEINTLMAKGQLTDLYARSEGPVWINEDNDGYPVMHRLSSDNLRAYLADHVNTYEIVKNPLTEGTKEVRALLQPRTCSTILGQKDWPLPKLRGMVTSPVVRPDGSLILQPGYDETTGLYLHPRVPLRRLRDEVDGTGLRRAREIIFDQMLYDFPWVNESDKAHFIGSLLTPILRPYFHGPTPMWVITAVDAGTGKSLLKDIHDYCFGLSNTPWPENEAELRKSITTQLATAGQPVVVFDNLPTGYVIKSATLSNLLTAPSWGDRLLGTMTRASMPNDRVWILTGNKLTTGGDNARRALWVRLDPQCPNPDQRDGFKVGDLPKWLRGNASTVVAALVTMVRSWLAADAPTSNVRMAGYSEWASMMGGLLEYLDVPGWLSDKSTSTVMDAEKQEWKLLLQVWREQYSDRGITSGQALIAFAPQIPAAKGGGEPTAKQFGHWLKAREGRFYDQYKLVCAYDSHLKQNVWRVEVYNSRGERGAS